MMKALTNHIKSLLFFLLLAACQQPEANTEDQETEEVSHSEEEVVLTPAQVREAGIQTGTFVYQEIGQPLEANGTIELPPNNVATISPVMDGFVESIHFLEGASVRKGTVLVALKDPAYIRLQQDYVQAHSRFAFITQELERQQTLNEAEVGAKKQLQQAQSEYNSLKAEFSALKEQLIYLGIDPASVLEGNMQNTVYLRAPFSGTVTALSAHKGEHIPAGQEIMEVINREHMHLELQVFQRDIPHVKEGQKILFTVPAFENEKVYQGTVSLVGKNLDMESKTIRVHGHFEEESVLIPGLYVEAQMMQGAVRRRVLPETAIVREEGKHYFFVKSKAEEGKTVFNKVAFEPGITSEGYVEVKNPEPAADTTAIVTQGAFYLKAAMNKGEGGHGH